MATPAFALMKDSYPSFNQLMSFRLLLCTVILATCAAALGQQSISLSSYPTISVADGKSTIAVYADVRGSNGKAVPDGTQVMFETTLGSFRESVVATVNGKAYATLVAGGQPGVAKISASSLAGTAAPAIMDFEFVADKSMLSNAMDYIELVAPGYMQYAADTRIIGAAGPNRGVVVRYRDMEVHADDVQITVPTFELRARNAEMKVGKTRREYQQLYMTLNLRRGYGTTTFKTRRWESIDFRGRHIRFVRAANDGSLELPPEQDRFGMVQIVAGEIRPTTEVLGDNLFTFEDLSMAPSAVSAKKAIIFPRREIQFQRAEIFVGGVRVMKMPLYQVDLLAQTTPLVTESMFSITDSSLAINYPHYLALRPGFTSLLRFRTGDPYGRGFGASGGAFVDYELNWNKGDNMQGNLSFRGLARNDFSISARQFLRMGDSATMVVQGEMIANRTLYGNASYNKQFDGFHANLSATRTQTLRGLRSSFEQTSLNIEKDPIQMGDLPMRLHLGFESRQSRNQLSSQHGTGFRARAETSAINLDPKTSFTSSFSVSKLFGSDTLPGLTMYATSSVSRRLTNEAALTMTYNFSRDGFNDRYSGMHRLNLTGTYYGGRTNFSIIAGKSLDKDRMNVYGDMSYQISGLWRLYGSYTLDKYLQDSYYDYNIAIGYRLGWREIGLTWSQRTKRIGFQLLGTNF